MTPLKLAEQVREALLWAKPYVARLRDTQRIDNALPAIDELIRVLGGMSKPIWQCDENGKIELLKCQSCNKPQDGVPGENTRAIEKIDAELSTYNDDPKGDWNSGLLKAIAILKEEQEIHDNTK